MSDDRWYEEEFDDYHSTTARGNIVDGKEELFGLDQLKTPGGGPVTAPFSPSTSQLTSSSHRIDSLSLDDDGDDFDDTPSLWVECKEAATGRTVFYNKRTLKVDPNMQRSPDKPVHSRTPSDSSNVNASASSLPNVLRTESETSIQFLDASVQQNAQILDAAWGGNDADAAPTTRVTAQSVVFGNAPDLLRKSTGINEIFRCIAALDTNVAKLMDRSHELSRSALEALTEIQGRVKDLQQAMEEDAQTRDNRPDVEALLELNKFAWNFVNDEVHGFRARAARAMHTAAGPRELSAPLFLSDYPLPPALISVPITIRFPEAWQDVMPYAKMVLNDKDTAADVLHKAHATFAKVQDQLIAGGQTVVERIPAENACILKAVGYRDYMEGAVKLFSFEYVRTCLRAGHPIEIALVPRPQPAVGSDDAKQNIADYQAKVDQSIRVLTVHDFTASVKDTDFAERAYHPIGEMPLPLRIRVCAVDNIDAGGVPRYDPTMSQLFVRVFLFHGMQVIPGSVCMTSTSTGSSAPRWVEWLHPNIPLQNLPRATRAAFLLYTKYYEKNELLAWCALQLIDQYGRLRSGPVNLKLWGMSEKAKEGDMSFIFRATTRDNLAVPNAAVLSLQFDEYAIPVVAPLVEPVRAPAVEVVGAEANLNKLDDKHKKQLFAALGQDPLYSLTSDDRKLVWTYRHHLASKYEYLPKFLQAVEWWSQEHRIEAHRLLALWAKPANPVDALELLDAQYPDYAVRDFAVTLLRSMSDEQLELILLQLCQCLKFEPYHDSPLTRLLIERALRSPYSIGHAFFWHLKVELGSPDFCERYGLILEEFLAHCGDFIKELRKQLTVVVKLQRVAELVFKLKYEHNYGDVHILKEYRAELEKLNRDVFGKFGTFRLPINPRLEATSLDVEKCKFMSSKKVPLWLVFNNHDKLAAPIYVIFKAGDDLRQDILTLQLLRIMDKIWLGNGLDMRLSPYRCIATGVTDFGEGVGMIEVVMNAQTTSGIQLKYGGGAIGALKLKPFTSYLEDYNRTKDSYEAAVDNFVRSCAGYCVATFVLGIGDRHNGNIMVTQDGKLFHIDFGHFLGNFKSKFGINRERSAFVFTPEMAYVMGGSNYENHKLFRKFKDLCYAAFHAVRKQAPVLESLFLLMVSAGMPELVERQDVEYLRDHLLLGASESEAEKEFKKEIKKSLQNTSRRVDNLMHIMKHKG